MDKIKIGDVLKCQVCGNIVEVLFVGGGDLSCCGKPMEKMAEKSSDDGREKHLPVIEETENGVKVTVGSIPHPMEESHYIMWIEIRGKDNRLARKYLKPGDKPVAEFNRQISEISFAREVCNVHGLWKKKM